MPASIRLLPERCPGALSCGLCLRACGRGVLMARPCGPRGAEEDAYRVVAVLRSRCDGCRRCQEACPHGALRVD